MERQTMPPLVWPSQSQLEHFFSSIHVEAIPFQEKQHELPAERKSELLQALGSTSASIIRLDDPGAAPTIAEIGRAYDFSSDESVDSLLRGDKQRTAFHITDRLTYSVLSGHYITRPDLLPFAANYDRWASCAIDVTEVFPRKRDGFHMSASLSSYHYDPTALGTAFDPWALMKGGSRMHTLLMDLGVEPTDHELSMADDYVLLGIDLSGYKAYEKMTGLRGFVYSDGFEVFASFPPPPKFVTPLALLRERHEEQGDLLSACLPKP